MKPTTTLLRLGVLFGLLTTTLASAQTPTVRFEQPSLFGVVSKIGGGAAHRGPSLDEMARDEVTFARSEKLTEVRWEGIWINTANLGGSISPTTDAWEIGIWSDNGGEPGNQLFLVSRPTTEVSSKLLGDSLVGPFPDQGTRNIPSYAFAFEFPEPFLMESGKTYWISVVSVASSNQPIFFWRNGARAGGPPAQQSMPTIYDWDNQSDQKGLDYNPHRNLTMKLVTIPAEDGDLDGLDDEWEDAHELDPATDDSTADPDEDGATNLREFEQRTDPNNPDSDGDGLLDGVESATGVYADASDTGTNPLFADSDRDGLGDSLEVPTEPHLGIAQPGTDPNQKDSDGDGYDDRLETRNAFSPIDPLSFPATIILGTGVEALETGGLVSSETIIQTSGGGLPANLFDDGLGSASADWISNITIFNSDQPLFVSATLGGAVVLDHFTIASSSSLPDRDPYSWEIQGSNDGIHFYTIFHWTKLNESAWTGRSQVLRFDAGTHYQTPQPYSVFRFACRASAPSANNEVQLGELQFFGTPFPSSLAPARVDPATSTVELQWTSLQDVTYTLERSSNLIDWDVIATGIPSGGPTTNFTDTTLSAIPDSLFYRVRTEE